MREKIVVVLFTVSFVFSHIADSMRTPELENKEFKVSFLDTNATSVRSDMIGESCKSGRAKIRKITCY